MRLAVNALTLTLCLALLPGIASAFESLPDFRELVKRNRAAVVNISTRRAPEVSQLDELPDLGNEDLNDLLRRYRDEQAPRQPSPDEETGQGSGFIISSDGYVMTNNHVVEDADTVIVRLHDRRQLKARVVGTDPRSDIALLKLDAGELPYVSIGNSDALEAGEWVLAIGSPFGFEFSVTAGIVSGTGRSLPRESYVPFIQTDVAINPGNSGGPLFNLRGEVIGINSQIYSRTGSFAGVSFAIPIELAMDVVDQLKTSGRVSRGWLGVVIQEVTLELAQSFGMRTAHGALVVQIVDDGPAASSSLRVGDVITHFEEQYVGRSSDLPPLVGRVPANTDARLRVVREGDTLELSVNIGELPGQQALLNRDRGDSGKDNVLQLEVMPVDAATRHDLGVDTGGVLVSAVTSGGAADEAGIAAGDVILMIDNKPVDTLADFREVVSSLEVPSSVAVLVQRADGEVDGPEFLAVRIE